MKGPTDETTRSPHRREAAAQGPQPPDPKGAPTESAPAEALKVGVGANILRFEASPRKGGYYLSFPTSGGLRPFFRFAVVVSRSV